MADEARLQDVAFQELTGQEDQRNEADPEIVGPELHDGEADGEHQADRGADIGNEADRARKEADQQPEIEPRQRQRRSIVDASTMQSVPCPRTKPAIVVSISLESARTVCTWSRGTRLSIQATIRSQSSRR